MLSSSPQPSKEDASSQRCVTPNRNFLDPIQDVQPQQQHQRPHWSELSYECDVVARMDGTFEFMVEGGSDNGEFPFFGSDHSTYQNISKGDIILEIQGQKVAGYTQRDVIAWLAHCSRNGNPVKIKAVKAGYLTKDLREYLNSRFQKGSLDHDLQNTIRDNLYLRTVPCTTRPPRCGEINGVDYTFLSVEEFIALERSGNLLESGIYEGNLYGTPRPAPAASAFSASISNLVQSTGWMVKPNVHGSTGRHPKELCHSPAKRNNSVSHVMPGAHASSEGKRRRNRSNVEAMASKTTDTSEYPAPSRTRSSTPVSNLPNAMNYKPNQFSPFSSSSPYDQEFPAMPDASSRSYMGNTQGYYLMNQNGQHWMDSRCTGAPRPSNFGDCDNDLPFGWERIDDPHYGTYYIDHVNRRTQYENPVLHARGIDQNASSRALGSRSLSWHSRSEQRSDHSRSLGPCSPVSDAKISPRTSRNSSLTQTTNCSNTHDSVTPANTNSESPLIDGNSSMPAVATSSNNPLSSSPASTHRFPYLHCIPCLNEKHDHPKHQLPSDSSKPDAAHLPNGNIASDAASDGCAQTSTILPDSSCHANFSSVGQGSDSTCRDFSHPSSLTGFNTIPKQPAFFTRNPDELRGILLIIPLVKSSRGLGFTIIGGDNPASQEFLQIKDVVPYGPAWCDGKLQTGDVLVRVNTTCVLGYSHKDIVSLFQSIPPGDIVELEVCRGYPLPFDPNDPNTEIVTTVAVSVANSKASNSQNVYSVSHSNSNSSRLMNPPNGKYVEPMSRAAKSLPDLSSKQPSFGNQNSSPGLHNASMPLECPAGEDYYSSSPSERLPKTISVGITKGAAGFGFTIADSSYGQKVKKILDRPRCKQLQEGDILTEINGKKVRELPHAEVVQILKECPCGDTAEILVQRDGFLQPVKNKAKPDNPNMRSDATESTIFPSYQQSSGRKDDKVFYNYRSKTPTAELYSSRDKDAVVIPRPKTPLVDSRNWTRSSPENNLSFASPEKPNLSFNGSSSRHRKRSDFKNGEQLDRETTDYLMFEPNYKSPPNHHQTWYSPSEHNTLNSEALDEAGITSLCKHFSTMPSSHYSSNPQVIDRSYCSSPGHDNLCENISKPHDDNSISDNPDLFDPDWKYTFNGSNYHGNQRSQLNSSSSSNAFFDSFKPGQDNGFSVYNAQPLSSQQVSSPSHVSSPSSFWNGTPPVKEFSHASDSIHRSDLKVKNSFSKRNGNSAEHDFSPSFSAPYHSRSNADSGTLNAKSSAGTSNGFLNMTVTLYRQNSGFGFRVVGGTEEGSQVCIGHIVPGGAADLDGHLQTGDELVAVDGKSVLNSSHQHAIQLINSAAAANGKVTLQVRRPNPSPGNNSETRNLGQRHDVTLVRKEDEGFGFVLISSLNRKGSAIGRITEGSPADRSGQLHIGDVIEAVNGISILDMHHGDIVSLIKDSGYSITLTISHPQDNSSSVASGSQKEDESSLDHDDTYHTIELQRGAKGFGFSIRGGKEFHNMPLFVLRIAENGPAHQDGRIKVGDQIIEINGVSTKSMTHAEAIELIREGGSTVRLLVKRNSQPVNILTGSCQRLPAHASPSQLFTPVSGSELVSHGNQSS